MSRSTNRLETAAREIKAGLRLLPLLAVVLLLAVILWRTDSAAETGLFQSPPSPLATPTPLPSTPTSLPNTPVVPASPTVGVPPGTPVTPTVSLPMETPTLLPTSTVEPTPTLTATATITPTEGTGTATPTPAAGSATVEATPDDRQRYPEEDSNLAFNLPMFFDSVALFLSYLWLCCGGLVFLAIPLGFVVLWVASKRRAEEEQ